MNEGQAPDLALTPFLPPGVDSVFDASVGRSVALAECGREFVQRVLNNESLPVLSSACPGWICYAEKSHSDHVLPYIRWVGEKFNPTFSAFNHSPFPLLLLTAPSNPRSRSWAVS